MRELSSAGGRFIFLLQSFIHRSLRNRNRIRIRNRKKNLKRVEEETQRFEECRKGQETRSLPCRKSTFSSTLEVRTFLLSFSIVIFTHSFFLS